MGHELLLTRFDAVLFDLDGTLVDSHGEICLALQKAFADVGLDFALGQIGPWVNGAALEDVWAQAESPAPECFEAFVHAYRTHYMADLGKHSRLFTGVLETLCALRERHPGLPLAVVSNKSARTVSPLLDAMGIAAFFQEALGCGGTPLAPKPDPQSLQLTAQRLDVPAPRCLMVGDTLFDVRAGLSAGMTTAVVTYGMGDAIRLSQSGAHYVWDSLHDLWTVLGRTQG